MKKFMSFMVVLLVTICMTGCSSKGETLKCTMEEDNTKSIITATIKDDKVTKISMESSETYESDDELSMAYSFGQMAVSMVDSIDGMTASAKKDGKTLKITMDMDLTKMSAADIKDNLGVESYTKDEFQKYAEEEGYTCK